MLIGIIGAMAEEVAALKQKMTVEAEYRQAGMVFFQGVLQEKPVVVVVSGIGKVNAAACTQILIDKFDVDLVINVGVAGGVGAHVHPGDVVVGSSLIQHDMDVTKYGYPLGQIPRLDAFDFKSDRRMAELALQTPMGDHQLVEGVIVSGDQFVASKEKVDFLVDTFGASATEMEGASIAQVAYLNDKPFVVIRSISDNASTGASMEYDQFVGIAVENSLKIIDHLLVNL